VFRAVTVADRRRDEVGGWRVGDGEIRDERRQRSTKRRNAGMSGGLCQPATKTAFAVRSAIPALCRNPLAAAGPAA
jgi:hypothetical protein